MSKTKSSIEMDINDPRAGKIADVMSSKTAKKVLHYIGEEGESSGSEIATELGLPLNTVTYNLKKLTDAGLIEKAGRAFWSSKGKKMELYNISNRKIVISPRIMSPNLIAGIVAGVVVLVLALLLINQPQFFTDRNAEDLSNEIRSFSSVEEIKNFLDENAGDYGYGIAKAESAVASAMPDTASAEDARSASEYSETNIQVQGVDEPDIVKNDGKYIYVVAGKKVVIVDAFPAESMEVLSKLEFDESVRNIFVNEDKLIVFVESYEYINSRVPCLEKFSFGAGCGGHSKQNTIVYVYDVSDKENPELENKIEFAGSYVEARMIDNYVYLISQKWIERSWFELPVYSVNGLEKTAKAGDIKYFDSYDENYVFNIIGAINLENEETNQEVYLMGSSTNIFVSQDNIYLTYMKQISQKYYLERYVDDAINEILPVSEKEKVEKIMSGDDRYWEKQNKIDKLIRNYIKSLDAEEGLETLNELETKTEEFYEKIGKETEKTVIHKIEIDGLDVNYEGRGEVPGNVLNQFSMDEDKGNFRIATTTGHVSRQGGGSLNHLYVLSKDLEIIGSVENLAEGERIYSVRFLGEKAYIVTFKKVDPLFVIDLENPENPEVLGYLKITGYSDYLHPYDENHIIGVGKETIEAREGDFAWYQGLKISLFDVSDFENPRETAKIEIGDRGTDSYALRDHKAFLFDKEKGILVIPVSLAEIQEDSYCINDDACYGEIVWQGAYVLNINPSEISIRGRVTHYNNNEEVERWGGGQKEIQRSLWMDNVLFTISQAKIKASDLQSVEEINEVEFGEEERHSYGEDGVGIAV